MMSSIRLIRAQLVRLTTGTPERETRSRGWLAFSPSILPSDPLCWAPNPREGGQEASLTPRIVAECNFISMCKPLVNRRKSRRPRFQWVARADGLQETLLLAPRAALDRP